MRTLHPLVSLALLACCTPGTGTADRGQTSTVSVPSGTDGRVTSTGVITCDDPTLRDATPMTSTIYGEDWPKTPEYRSQSWDLFDGGRGVVVADFDGDNDVDVLVPRDLFRSNFLRNNGDGSFTDDTMAALGDLTPGQFNGGSAADLDSDGDMDAILYGLLGTATLAINDGSGRFSMLPMPEWDTGDSGYGCGGSAAWTDYDRDGDLDLFYGRLGGSDPVTDVVFTCDSQLLVGNGGDGTFTSQTAQISQNIQETRIMVAGWYDFDDNGHQDLYVVSDAPPMANWLMWNDGGTLTEATESGLGIIVAGMGLGVGDLNADRLPDVMVTGIEELPLMLSSRSSGLWFESSAAMGLFPDPSRNQVVAWGGELADMDNDGLLDVVVTYGDFAGSASPFAQPDDIHLNDGSTFSTVVGEDYRYDDLSVQRGFVVTDLNADGWLDVVKKELGGVVYVNLATCGDGRWLEIQLNDGLHANHHAVGARITVTAGDQEHTRWIHAGSTSYASGGPPIAHFGLGEATEVDAIEVVWPTGEVETYGGQQANQILTITR